MINKNLQIHLRRNTIILWNENEYDDYSYEGSVFVVKKNGEWVGIYNMAEVIAIEVGRE